MNRTSVLVAAAVVVQIALGAQQQAPSFRSSVDVIAVDVHVVERDGRPIAGLRADEFLVTVDGKPRAVETAEFVLISEELSVSAYPGGQRSVLAEAAGITAAAQKPAPSDTAARLESASAKSRALQLAQGVDRDLRLIDKGQLTRDERKQCDDAKALAQRARRLLQGANETEALSLAMAASKEVAPLIRRQLQLDRLMVATEQYRSGRIADALHAVSESLASDLDGPVRYIEDNRDRLGVEGTSLVDINDRSLAALCLLETEVASLGRYDSAARVEFARRLLQVVDTARLPQRFVERWYIAVAGHLQGNLQLTAAMLHVEDAVRRFPDDSDILLVAGMFYELMASPSVDVLTRATQSRQGADARIRGAQNVGVGNTSMVTGPPPVDERDDRLAKAKRTGLTRAEELYHMALAADQGQEEAHLRLGRILYTTSRLDAALAELRLAAGSREPRMHYLASMFEGAVHETAGRLDAAIASYEEAVLACPTCLTGGIALSHAQRQNKAPEVATRTLDLATRRAEFADFWWDYPLGRLWQRDLLMRELRGSLR